jgi:hypothetical protein
MGDWCGSGNDREPRRGETAGADKGPENPSWRLGDRRCDVTLQKKFNFFAMENIFFLTGAL